MKKGIWADESQNRTFSLYCFFTVELKTNNKYQNTRPPPEDGIMLWAWVSSARARYLNTLGLATSVHSSVLTFFFLFLHFVLNFQCWLLSPWIPNFLCVWFCSLPSLSHSLSSPAQTLPLICVSLLYVHLYEITPEMHTTYRKELNRFI